MKSEYYNNLKMKCEDNPNTPLYLLLQRTNKVLKVSQTLATFTINNGGGHKKKVRIISTK